MERTDSEFYGLIHYMENIVIRKDYGATAKVFYIEKTIARFKGTIDIFGNVTPKTEWFVIPKKQNDFFEEIKTICCADISYANKLKEIKIILADF